MNDNGNNIKIHETAFVTSMFRALNENLSQDFHAKLWNDPNAEQWMNDYLEQVSSEEVSTHCLRNRYFLETVKNAIEERDVDVLINFGSGFSMYPFLLSDKLTNIEIDKPEIVNFKKNQVAKWIEVGKLPKRDLHFIGVDFSSNYEDELFSKINDIKGNRTSFILIEGVLFFLDRRETDRIFNFFSSLQCNGGYVGSASFQNSIKDSLAFKRLLEFFNRKVSKTKASDYQTIEDDYYRNKAGYELIDHQDYFSLSKQYRHEVKLERESILNEHFYLLQRQVDMDLEE